MTGVGTNIAANDYNAIQGAIAGLLGTGIGGYGQTVRSGQVSTSGTILASDWQALLTDIAAVNYHQLNAAPRYNGVNLTVPSNGTGVSNTVGSTTYTNASPAVKIKEADRAAYLAVARALVNLNPSTVGSVNYPGCYTTNINASQLTTIAAGAYLAPSVRVGTSSPWGSTNSGSAQSIGSGQEGIINMIVTLTFPTALAAQYYFNTGGSVILSGGATAGQTAVAGTKDQSWSILLSNMGNVVFNYTATSSSSGNGVGTSYGWSYFNANRNVTQTIYTITTSSSLYAPNQADVLCSLSSSGTVLTFTFQLQDLSTAASKVSSGVSPGDTNLYSIDTPVTATVSGTITISYASGSYVSSQTPTSYLPIPVITTPFTA
jgi:hypothetical protein